MRRSFVRIKGMGYILWHGKHEFIHILLALVWAWFLRELWSEFNVRWVIAAIFGGLLPDIDHVLYYVAYRKRDPYAKLVLQFLKQREWRILAQFIETTHKYNTNLSFHNIYIALLLFSFCAVSYVYDWRVGVVLFGAMVTHYLYDIVDDFLILGYMNPNWKRLGRAKSRRAPAARVVDDLS
jgi:hypothetical protein